MESQLIQVVCLIPWLQIAVFVFQLVLYLATRATLRIVKLSTQTKAKTNVQSLNENETGSLAVGEAIP